MNLYVKALISTACRMIMNAKSGHTGMAISSTKINFTLFTQIINLTNNNCKWINRDRFILSAGHGSANLYALLYLAKALTLDEINQFRHGCVNTAGHPEYSFNNYIDVSTGPLGQGVANAVGMAIAEKYLANRWKELKGLIDHYTYVLVGDGDLQEGISYEAMSLAGKLNLNKLIMLYDSNSYQLDSSVDKVNIEDIALRLKSQNWNYFCCQNEINQINECLLKAKQSDKPTFIEVKTIIGEGTTKQASHQAHGLAINNDELKHIFDYYQIDFNDFNYDQSIFDFYQTNVFSRGNQKYQEWLSLLDEYKQTKPLLVEQFLNNINNQFVVYNQFLNLDELKDNQPTKTYLKNLFDQLINQKDIMTLSADLASTTNCKLAYNNQAFNDNIDSGYVMVGIREFAMGAIQNGILLHKGLKCFSGTFLVFSDYIKSAIRLGAMMQVGANYILTHDSYLVGNDGPTHQPYDQIPMLRAIENVYILRPCDQREVLACLQLMLENTKHTYCLCLSRQNIVSCQSSNVQKAKLGAYIIYEDDSEMNDLILIANGSEVDLAFRICQLLKSNLNLKVRIISCLGLKLFLNQSDDYIKQLIQSRYGLVCIEPSSDYYWYALSEYTKNKIKVIRAHQFGYSDDGIKVYEHFGFNVDNIYNIIRKFVDEQN